MREPVTQAEHPECFDMEARDYDALLVVSFGGPEGPDDVMPFLDNVLRGLNLPPPAVKGIAKRYEAFGGVSPINAHTRDLIAALERELRTHDIDLPIYWGNRNWHPYLTDTVVAMRDAGVERALAFVTSTFGSYSGCRRYREDLFATTDGVDGAPIIDRLRAGYNHPGFIDAVAERVREALARVPDDSRDSAPLIFTAHSLPVAMADQAPYQAQLIEAASLVTEAVGRTTYEFAYQSNNASYGNAWLEPRIEDMLVEQAQRGTSHVVVVPIGFVCDHMEVVLDLDVDAQKIADEHGLTMIRAGTVGSHPSFVAMIRELIEERTQGAARRAVGHYGPSHDRCPVDCCLSGRPGPAKPALCGADGAA
jgi:ferrochelatase